MGQMVRIIARQQMSAEPASDASHILFVVCSGNSRQKRSISLKNGTLYLTLELKQIILYVCSPSFLYTRPARVIRIYLLIHTRLQLALRGCIQPHLSVIQPSFSLALI